MTEMEEIKTMLADMNKKLDKVIFQNKIALNTKYGSPIKQENAQNITIQNLDKIDELQKQVDELKQENSILSITVEMHDKVEQQAVKDTAKEICDIILEHWEKKQFVECDWLRVYIAEKYGVEVE